MNVTIKQVAQTAKVSVATVSRVLNAKGPARAETRQRVLRAARRLGYVPHGGARSLITRRTDSVGVLLPDLYGEFFSEVIRGIDLAARRAGFHLLVSSSHSDRSEIELVLRAMRGRVDGLIVMSPSVDARTLQANLSDKLPVILLSCRVDGSPFEAINIANYDGAYAMVRHLFGRGHRRIAFVKGAQGNYDAQERLRGYRAAVRLLGAERDEGLELPGNFGEESGYRAARRALDLDPRPSVIFAANDAMAIGALSALREASVSVPDQMALAGFDDIPVSRFLTPPLTTVRVGIAELGARAAERLIELVKRPKPHENRRDRSPITLVVRRSCGAPPPPSGFHPVEDHPAPPALDPARPPPDDKKPSASPREARSAGARRASINRPSNGREHLHGALPRGDLLTAMAGAVLSTSSDGENRWQGG